MLSFSKECPFLFSSIRMNFQTKYCAIPCTRLPWRALWNKIYLNYSQLHLKFIVFLNSVFITTCFDLPGHLHLNKTYIYIYIYTKYLKVKFTKKEMRSHVYIKFSHLKTKRRLLYLKTHSVPRCNQFSSRL